MQACRSPEQRCRVLGELVRETRKSLDLTQDELALVAGVSARTIHVIEHGKPTVQLRGVLAVLRALDFEIELSHPGSTG